MNVNDINTVLTVHSLIQKGIPKEVNNIIARFGISLLWCENCEKVLQKYSVKKQNISWTINEDQKILCKNCIPNLQNSFKKRFKK